MRNRQCGIWRVGIGFAVRDGSLSFAEPQQGHLFGRGFALKLLPRNEEKIAFWDLARIFRSSVVQCLRFAQDKQASGRQIVHQSPELSWCGLKRWISCLGLIALMQSL